MNKFESMDKMLRKLHMNTELRHQIMKQVCMIEDFICNRYHNKKNIGVIRSNSDYGHEYWIKEYCNFDKSIYALIEHGVYFGKNTNKVGIEYDYELKTILTYGNYREEILKIGFPKYNVYKIGPRIAYAKTDSEYFKKLIEESQGKKVLTIFPTHSTKVLKANYDIKYLLSEAYSIMNDRSIEFLRVCLPQADIDNGTADLFIKEGCTVVSAGQDKIQFLPRLRAIIEASNLTMSNSLGTNLGYCIYLNRQQILIPQEQYYEGEKEEFQKEFTKMRSNNSLVDFKLEQDLFLSLFNKYINENITTEQIRVCDYYWGFSDVKTKEQMHILLKNIYEKSNKKIKENN